MEMTASAFDFSHFSTASDQGTPQYPHRNFIWGNNQLKQLILVRKAIFRDSPQLVSGSKLPHLQPDETYLPYLLLRLIKVVTGWTTKHLPLCEPIHSNVSPRHIDSSAAAFCTSAAATSMAAKLLRFQGKLKISSPKTLYNNYHKIGEACLRNGIWNKME